MRRDNDFLRALLLRFEEDPDPQIDLANDASDEATRELYHIKLLLDAGLLAKDGRYGYRLTNAAHDYLDAIRDEGIWKRTKEAVATSGGNATLEILKALSLGFLKKQIKERTGFDV